MTPPEKMSYNPAIENLHHGPRYMRMHPTLQIAYVVNEVSSTVGFSKKICPFLKFFYKKVREFLLYCISIRLEKGQ